MVEHAVIVRFEYGSTDLTSLFELEDQLESALEDTDAGYYDGHEIAVDGSDGLLFFFGPDADALFGAISATLLASSAIKNAIATLRYGPPEDGIRQAEVVIAA